MKGFPSSLRRRVRIAFAVAVTLAMIATGLGVVGFASLLSARRQLVERVDPALTTSERLLAALVDQETGVRAYVLIAREPFVEPFQRGGADQEATEQELEALIGDEPRFAAGLQRISEAALRWRDDYAIPTLAAVAAGDTGPATVAALDAGRRLFDDVRTAIDALQAELQEERDRAVDELSDATTRLVLTLVGAAAALVASVGLLWGLIHRSVQRPLDHLGADARLVAGGAFDHSVTPVGPAELRRLAEAVEAMRERVVAAFEEAERARAESERRAVELDRSNAELEQFAYVASHDLQEPLRKVASFCQLLQSRYGGQLDERADQYIEFAVDGAKRMQALINDLLAFSRVGRVASEEKELLDLDDAVAEAEAGLALAIQDAGATVTSDDLPVVRGEPSLLVGVFQNLIGNALKFRREGVAPRVHIGVAHLDGAYEIAVSDNGIGIEPDYAERVFVIFQRLHAKDRYEGTGIGLALCRKIVEYHGGEIRVDTEVTSGTTIRFTLPVPGDDDP